MTDIRLEDYPYLNIPELREHLVCNPDSGGARRFFISKIATIRPCYTSQQCRTTYCGFPLGRYGFRPFLPLSSRSYRTAIPWQPILPTCRTRKFRCRISMPGPRRIRRSAWMRRNSCVNSTRMSFLLLCYYVSYLRHFHFYDLSGLSALFISYLHEWNC